MSGAASAVGSTGLLVAIVVFLFVRRIIASVRGTRLSEGRLFGYAALLGGIFALTTFAGITILPWYAVPLDLAVVAALGVVSYLHVQERVVIERVGPDQWIYRLGPLIPIVYLVLFVVRLGLDLAMLNVQPFGPSGLPVSLSPTTTVVFLVVDVLFAASTGLSIGRSVGVYREWQRLRADPPSLPPTPTDRPLP